MFENLIASLPLPPDRPSPLWTSALTFKGVAVAGWAGWVRVREGREVGEVGGSVVAVVWWAGRSQDMTFEDQNNRVQGTW